MSKEASSHREKEPWLTDFQKRLLAVALIGIGVGMVL